MPRVTWTLKGRLLLEPASQIKEYCNERVPLAGVRVKVSAKQFGADPTGWQKWDEGITDEDGNFELSNVKNETNRLFRVRVQFKDDDLKVYPENDGILGTLMRQMDNIPGPIDDIADEMIFQALDQFTRLTYKVPWYTVSEAHGSSEKRGPDTVFFGDLVFRDGGDEELGELFARRHAEIWYIVKRAMKLLSGYDAGLGFPEKKPIAFKYPHNNFWIGDGIEDPYANPHNDTVYLIRNEQTDNFDAETILHELGHLWMYQHCTQEERIMYAIPGGTHDVREDEAHVAFHEAFAEFFKNEVYRKLFDGKPGTYLHGGETKRLPFSRDYIRSLGCTMLAGADHYEKWWYSCFNLLVCDRLRRMDLNTGSLYATPNQFDKPAAIPDVTFEDFLKCFQPDLARQDMTVDGFLDRLRAALPQIDASDEGKFRALFDPLGVVQPHEVFGLEAVLDTGSVSGAQHAAEAPRGGAR